ncbi:MAG: DUF3793 family protein [Clostridia bacterium]|nr:DUF3793 family protein [Clostridia bacterium]
MNTSCLVSDCLNDYDKYRTINIMMRLGPTLMGYKPLHIFCFKNDFKFIKQIIDDVVCLFSKSKHVKYRLVFSQNGTIKIVIYNLDAMKGVLEDPRIRHFLSMHGYDSTSDSVVFIEQLAEHLKNNALPSEFGVFFGYPLKDVMGFIGHPSLKYVKTTAWKVYGNPRSSDKVLEAFKCAEAHVLSLCQSLPMHSVVSEIGIV